MLQGFGKGNLLSPLFILLVPQSTETILRVNLCIRQLNFGQLQGKGNTAIRINKSHTVLIRALQKTISQKFPIYYGDGYHM